MSGGLRLAIPSGRWVLLATILGSALAGIDATVVNVALPAIGDSLGAGFTGLQWTVTAYALTLASFILLGGTLGDLFGRRRVFLLGVVWFAVASLVCGLSVDVTMLIAARAVQGVGAALLTPGSLSILQAGFERADRARAIGAWSGLGGVATAVGPLLGGWLVDVASWRWVFLINVPLAALVVLVALRHVPESRDATVEGQHVDWLGGVTGAVALGSLSYALIEGGRALLPALGVAVVAGAAFALRERTAAYPVLPLRVFASAQFSAVNAVTFVVYGGIGLLFFLLVVQLQVSAGFGPVEAGVASLPVTVLMLLLSPRSGALAARIGPRVQMTVGPALAAVGLLLLSRVGPGASYAVDVLPGVVVFGAGLSALVAPLTAAALAAAPAEHAGMASGVNNAVARTGQLLAVAAVPALVGLSGAGYADPSVFTPGYRHALWIAAGAVALGGVVAALFVRNDVLEDDEVPPSAGA
ncbi:MFS transporter [Marmoricola endophyticus]|uniref:MFS transporter n=1 Tax=Marmoricola endophyticus TaxID=2040280 RepID=A0A917BFJ3_9ACTN|nr:MFS transporter [Marmoricola endophyticus]GGF37673.1 MFS transporter [Marmoricola endophyticus]